MLVMEGAFLMASNPAHLGAMGCRWTAGDCRSRQTPRAAASWALNMLALMANLSRAERERDLMHALKVNRV
jgi:hypothetical protein